MKNLNVFSLKLFFFIIVFLKKTRQCIYNPICLALIIIYPKIIARKLLGLLNLIRIQALCFYKTAKVVVINKNKDFVLAIF